MSTYKIEKGIPVPEMGEASKYPFSQMEIGDSFLIPNKKTSQTGYMTNKYALKYGRKFVSRQVGNDVRVWRTE